MNKVIPNSEPVIMFETWDGCTPEDVERLRDARFIGESDEWAYYVLDGNMVKVRVRPK